MSNNDDSFLANLPAEWKIDRFKDMASLRNEKTDKASEEEDYLELEDFEICAHLDEKTAELNRIVATIESQISTLSAYRRSLIHECVTGRCRITEADVVRTQNKQRPT